MNFDPQNNTHHYHLMNTMLRLSAPHMDPQAHYMDCFLDAQTIAAKGEGQYSLAVRRMGTVLKDGKWTEDQFAEEIGVGVAFIVKRFKIEVNRFGDFRMRDLEEL